MEEEEEVVVVEAAGVAPAAPDARPVALALLLFPGAPLLETPPADADGAAPWEPPEGAEPEDCAVEDWLEAAGAGFG